MRGGAPFRRAYIAPVSSNARQVCVRAPSTEQACMLCFLVSEQNTADEERDVY